MTKIQSVRRLLLPCFTSSPISTAPTPSKKRLSTSLRDPTTTPTPTTTTPASPTSSTSSNEDTASSLPLPIPLLPPRPSKSMVICTFFGLRRSHVTFCVQLDRLSPKPSLLLSLSLSTLSLVHEMHSGLLRLALESQSQSDPHLPLHSIPVFTLYCNGRKAGFASRRKPSDETRAILKKMQSMTVGAGVIPLENGGDVMYMRANYEWVVGGADSESYHLISPDDDCPGQDLSVFLFRTRK